MGYWVKKFADGGSMTGTDRDVSLGIASWSKSDLDGMVGVELEHNGFILSISGAGEYWQSDTYEVLFPDSRSALIKRRIEKKIDASDAWARISKKYRFVSLDVGGWVDSGMEVLALPPEWQGRWLVLELDIRTQQAKYYIGSDRI